MDIELLKTFLEVRRTRHFGKAADNLHLTQAAVSARIRQLETLLGVKLFLRSRNNIQLTSEGERLVPHAQTVLLSWTRARQELALETGQISQIHIGVRSGLWSGGLQSCLAKLHTDMPEIVLRTEGHMTDAAAKMLLDRTLDIAISYDPPSLPEFKTREIGKVTLRLYSRDKKASVAKALARDYVYVDWGSSFARFHAKHFGDAVSPVLRTNLSESAQHFLVDTGGAAYLLASAAESSKPKLYAVENAPDYQRSLVAAYRGNSAKLELIESVLDVFDGLNL